VKNMNTRFGRIGIAVLSATALAQAIFCSFASGSPKGECPLTFAMPKDAVQAMIAACEKNDVNALLGMFGPEGKDIIQSGDPSDDADRRARFAKSAHEKYKLIQDTTNPDKMFVSIGKNDWPFPVPLARKEGRWSFDSAEGAQEIIARRIGKNELDAIEICRGYVDAQFEYAQDHRRRGVPEYAQYIVSSTGTQDGLYWETGKDGVECQVPKGFADAAVGMSMENQEPYHGYYFRILTAQGPEAHGGAVNYLVNGSMIGGFALVAWPAEYGVSGIQTFMVNHDGTVYEADLGADTVRNAAEMTEFNPDDPSWHPVQPESIVK